MGPNAVITNITQQKSKMSELAHAEFTKLERTQNDYVLKSRTLGDNVRGGVVGRWDVSGRSPQVRVSDNCVRYPVSCNQEIV